MRLLDESKKLLGKFGLELHPDKTRLIEFGRYMVRDRKRRGKGKRETFTLFGLAYDCGQRHKTETCTVSRITAKKQLAWGEVGARIKARRLALGVTQVSLAQASGVDKTEG